jgi:cell shape-determining protein MreC
MKKTFLAKRNALISGGPSWGIFVLLFAVLVVLMRFVAPNLFWPVVSPLLTLSNKVGEKSSAFFSSFSNAADLARRNEQLANENRALVNENAALLERLRGASFSAENSQNTIVAGVLSRPPQSPYDSFIVSAGTTDGVTLGMEAFSGTVPLGMVTSVFNHYARITLFSSPEMEVQGWLGETRTPVAVYGQGGGTFSAAVPRTAPVQENDRVYVPGPGMLPIGSVVRIDSDPSSPVVLLHIKPVINLFSVGWVELRDIGSALRSATTTP